jgi:hypothetical protein
MSEVIETKAGRRLEVQRLGRRDSMRLMRQWGKASEVQMWFGQALLAACVRGIDSVPVLMPDNPDKAEALVEKLDDDGLIAVANWLENSAADDPKEFKDAVKN